jgi:hypothetical protein
MCVCVVAGGAGGVGVLVCVCFCVVAGGAGDVSVLIRVCLCSGWRCWRCQCIDVCVFV